MSASRKAGAMARRFGSRLLSLERILRCGCLQNHTRTLSTKTQPTFGLFFDIDGVIVRGRQLLPSAREAFQLLTDKNGKFWVPTIFVTNAGNTMRQNKASQLSDWLGVEVVPDQVVMSHSPLKMFRQFLDKHVLVTGQGPTKEIARGLGFTKVTTIETFRQCFPMLDMVDHKRRKTAPCAFEKYFPKIEAVIMFGEPVRWETNLQLILDILLSNGQPHDLQSGPAMLPYPHLPILACNMDLMWMSEAAMPRFAHGCFLHCLESLYQKITGHELKYTALVGKPSEITYHHSEHVLQTLARNMGLPGIHHMYCIGDNPDVDIYGANLFHRYLSKREEKRREARTALKKQQLLKGSQNQMPYVSEDAVGSLDGSTAMTGAEDVAMCGGDELVDTQTCDSVLVCTGVYSHTKDHASHDQQMMLSHIHRDFIMDTELKKPTMMAHNVYDALQAIFRKEGIS